MKKATILSLLITISLSAFCQSNIIKLWPNQIPNSQKSNEKEIIESTGIIRISKVQNPTLEVFLPAKNNANGQAVVICPGGGYGILAYDWEGTDIAKWLNSKGIAAFVLKYRLPQSKSVIESNKAPLQDAIRALKTVRYNADKYNISKDKIGVMGFSAGGHLASTLGTHYNESMYTSVDAIDTVSARPDFMALIYPVISMKDGITHKGSRRNLLGDSPSDEMINYFSNELKVTKDTPPTFLIHASDDNAVPVQNSLLMYQALISNGVYTEMHIYPKGGHGFSFGFQREHVSSWTDLFCTWMQSIPEKYSQL
ncbi:alpha/beta hydrolase [Labilibaculum antarcticum]|uniref:Esterase n=1 Tax=Labilibaculum antarcticum TaxID=1717717 RepID=A0A1Y1CGP0_9BACT|nr:alpha/beta hydrolase [Labilibaculum antarcticum]BAX78451.1 esterase [Labilibaculum antarcticum]